MTPLTDEQRLEAVREIWELGYKTGRETMAALYEYERLAKEGLRAGQTIPSPPPVDAE